MKKHIKKGITKLQNPHYLALFLAVITLIFLAVLYVVVTPSEVNKKEIAEKYSEKLVNYYESNKTFPKSLMDLEGANKQEIIDATLVYRAELPNGQGQTSFYANELQLIEGESYCKFEIYTTNTDSSGENIQKENIFSKSYCG